MIFLNNYYIFLNQKKETARALYKIQQPAFEPTHVFYKAIFKTISSLRKL